LISGEQLVQADQCPFCDRPWDLLQLKEHVQSKVNHLKEISRKRKAVEKKISPLPTLLRNIQVGVDGIVRNAVLLKPPLPLPAMHAFALSCRQRVDVLTTLLPLTETLALLPTVSSIPEEVATELQAF